MRLPLATCLLTALALVPAHAAAQDTSFAQAAAVVYGVGRPSLVDLEERTYAFKPLDKPPPPPKHAK